ncbi:MAG: T9SS type A sorting domain-containing protein [Flavobacteriales bacterium]|nr:T9SS type A sorting domain-containing protein [Flavobacteriales bacterium]
MRRSTASTCCSLLLVATAEATAWTVGPGQTYTMPSQVSTLVGDGDTVNIEAGVYPSDVARWQVDNLVLRGVGGVAHLESNGLSWGDKAIWVIQGNNTTVEWIEFSECQVPDHNGAGIRHEGLNLTVRHCWFHHNENGILCGEYHPSTVRIEYSEFGHHGFGDGYSHNLYIGNVDSLIFRYNYSHHADVGHELKSRAWVNVIEYNRIGNEADGTASREIDLPNGGQAYLIGNVIQQGLQSENSNIVGFGMEGLSNPGPQEFYAVNNTIVNEKANGSFFQAPADVFFKAYNNVLAGGGEFMPTWPTSIDTLANLRATNIVAVQFADAATYDYHIDEASPAHNLGFPAGLATTGYPLVALYEYVHPTSEVLRCQHATLDAGAFETCTTGMAVQVTGGFELFPNPAADHVAITVPTGLTVTGIELIDGQGRVVRRMARRTMDLARIDVSDLAAGLFTARVSTSTRPWQRPFVKLP